MERTTSIPAADSAKRGKTLTVWIAGTAKIQRRLRTDTDEELRGCTAGGQPGHGYRAVQMEQSRLLRGFMGNRRKLRAHDLLRSCLMPRPPWTTSIFTGLLRLIVRSSPPDKTEAPL